jgi:hypothetical protein
VQHPAGRERPSPGLVHVCRRCAAIQVFGDDLQFRELTDEERRKLPAEVLREHEDIARTRTGSIMPRSFRRDVSFSVAPRPGTNSAVSSYLPMKS